MLANAKTCTTLKDWTVGTRVNLEAGYLKLVSRMIARSNTPLKHVRVTRSLHSSALPITLSCSLPSC